MSSTLELVRGLYQSFSVGDIPAVLGAEWDGFAAVPKEFVAQGATVVALGDYSGTYRATGKSFTAPFAHVWKFEGGKAVSFHQYTDTAVHLGPLQP